MANQPSSMVPNSAEQSPQGFDVPESLEKNPSSVQESPEHVSTPEQHVDQASADVVREKLVSEAAGIAQATSVAPAQTQPSVGSPQLSTMNPDDQVQQLVNVAHASGLDHAFKMAKATNNAYVIDRFHDELVNRVLHNKQQSM